MVMAYEKLPDTIKQRIDGLYAKHSAEHIFGAQLPIAERHAMAAKNPAAEHPVVLTHPETGEKVLFVNSAFTTHFSNFFNFEDIRYGQDFMPEAHQLMNYLTSQAAIPEYQVRLKWRTNTVAMWDNLQVQHYAVADYGNAPKERCCAPPSRATRWSKANSFLWHSHGTKASRPNVQRNCRAKSMASRPNCLI
jgi:taurine dioxygenase